MAESSPRPARTPQSGASTPSITSLLSFLSCCVGTAECHHDTNPWSDSDPELQIFSTAALEALQEHATHRVKSLSHVHQVLEKELANRKLESRFMALNTNQTGSSSKPGEVLFNAHDFEPLVALLGAQDDTSGAACERPDGDQRDIIAKMCIAWVDKARGATRTSRDDGTRPVSARHRAPDETAAVVDVEGAETGSIASQDVEALEDEMEVYS